MRGLLRTAEEKNSELEEQLKNANTSVEQYRAVVLTLEDSLKKEKEVQLFYLLFLGIYNIFCLFSYTLLSLLLTHTCPTCELTIHHSSVSLPSGDPTKGVGGGAEAAGEENFGGGENEAAGARTEETGCGCSGKTSEHDASIYEFIHLYK